jgi:hypothetical protein
LRGIAAPLPGQKPGQKRPKMLGQILGLMLWLMLGGSVKAATEVPWLYEVSVPVLSQSTEERQRAAAEALWKLLTRLTGLAYVPRTPEVVEALSRTETYYSEFRFSSDAEKGLSLIVQFDPQPVLELVRSAQLPIWRASRERVLAWVVIQDQGQRTIVGATSESPLVTGFEERALDRGIALTVPLLDLEDQLAVEPAAVWGRLSQVVDPASERYGADVLLLGRVTADPEAGPEGGWHSDWEFWVDGMVVPFTVNGADLAEHAAQAVDILSDELAGRRVVHGGRAGELRIAVNGIREAADYGSLLRYLRGLEFIDAVNVVEMRGNRLWLTLFTPARPAQLLEAFERDHRMFDDQLAAVGDADLKLVWRHSD